MHSTLLPDGICQCYVRLCATMLTTSGKPLVATNDSEVGCTDIINDGIGVADT